MDSNRLNLYSNKYIEKISKNIFNKENKKVIEYLKTNYNNDLIKLHQISLYSSCLTKEEKKIIMKILNDKNNREYGQKIVEYINLSRLKLNNKKSRVDIALEYIDEDDLYHYTYYTINQFINMQKYNIFSYDNTLKDKLEYQINILDKKELNALDILTPDEKLYFVLINDKDFKYFFNISLETESVRKYLYENARYKKETRKFHIKINSFLYEYRYSKYFKNIFMNRLEKYNENLFVLEETNKITEKQKENELITKLMKIEKEFK